MDRGVVWAGGLCGQGGWMGDNHQLELCSSGWRRQNKYFQAKTKETYDLQPWENFFGEYMKRSIYDEYSCKIGFNTRFQLDNDVSRGSAIFFFIFFSLLCPRMWSLLRSGTERYVLEIRKRQAPPQFLPQKSITKYHRRKGVFAHTFLTNIYFFPSQAVHAKPSKSHICSWFIGNVYVYR